MSRVYLNLMEFCNDLISLPKCILYVCSVSVLFTGGYSIYLIYKYVLSSKSDNCNYPYHPANKFIVLSFILGMLYMPFLLFNCGSTKFGDFFEKRYYTDYFYVYITDDLRYATRYKAVAQIEKTSSGINKSHYFIKNVFFERSVNFSDKYRIGAEITPGKETYCNDNNDHGYYITLSFEKAPKPIRK